MKLSTILAAMLDAKADHEMIRRTILDYEAEQTDGLAKRRESDAKRQAEKRARDNHVMSRDVTVTVPSRARVEGSSSKEEIDKKENKKERATRLTKEWTLPIEWFDEARNAGLAPERVGIEARKMLNWSLSAKDGAKLDWHAAWRNWFQRALEAKATAPPKKVTLASMWRDEGRKLGIISDEPPHEIDRRLEISLGDGLAPDTNFARRIAGARGG